MGCALALIALWLPVQGLADPTVTALVVTPNPTPSVVAEYQGSQVFSVNGGDVVQLAVTALLDDGSSLDVTSDATTSYTSVAPAIASCDAFGELTFLAPSGPGNEAAAVLVEHGSASRLISFSVRP